VPIIPLELLSAGESARIVEIDGDNAFVNRLNEMGLSEDAKIKMVQSIITASAFEEKKLPGSLSRPIDLLFRGSSVSLCAVFPARRFKALRKTTPPYPTK
jgi:hypothetical protein